MEKSLQLFRTAVSKTGTNKSEDAHNHAIQMASDFCFVVACNVSLLTRIKLVNVLLKDAEIMHNSIKFAFKYIIEKSKIKSWGKIVELYNEYSYKCLMIKFDELANIAMNKDKYMKQLKDFTLEKAETHKHYKQQVIFIKIINPINPSKEWESLRNLAIEQAINKNLK